MKEPKRIRKNSFISLVAPSFGCTAEPYKTRLEKSIKIFKSLGFNVKEGKNIYLNDGVAASNTPKDRAKEFMDAYLDDKSDIVWSVGGGETMCEILPFIDFELIKNSKPKWFIGFSDNTNLTFTLTTLSNLITIYGPCANKFFLHPFKYDSKDTLYILNGVKEINGYDKREKKSLADEENPLTDYNLTKDVVIKSYSYTKSISGMLLGGCLDCLITLCGTKYDNMKKFNQLHKDIIWFLEACDLNPLGIRRALFTLKEAGWFKNAKGFLIGRPLCDDLVMMEVDKEKAVIDILGDLDVPILLDVPLGHYSPSMPMKNGAYAIVTYKNNNLTIKYI